MAQDWNIQSRGEACHSCKTPFEDQQVYYSVLIFKKEGYCRSDYCKKCQPDKLNTSSLYSTWQGVFKLPPEKPEEVLKKETAESLLRRIMEDKKEADKNVIYILAVMLERKRILIERNIQTDAYGSIIRVYEHRKTGESFLINDPQLKLDQLEQVQHEVSSMLGRQDDKKEHEQKPDNNAQISDENVCSISK